MTHPSKRKGNRFERELREAFREAGLRAERAYASNGESLTTDGGDRCGEGVDLLVEGGLKVQAKRRASVAQYLSPPDGAHLTVGGPRRGALRAPTPASRSATSGGIRRPPGGRPETHQFRRINHARPKSYALPCPRKPEQPKT
jgi:hypothetical protein